MAVRDVYKNSKGDKLPSVTQIIGRFKDSGGLLYWANEQGIKGLTLQEARVPAATSGTMAHDLVEADIHNQPEPQLTGNPEIIIKARAAFGGYKQWTKLTNLEILYTEVSLVSEKHQFGGRLDAVGIAKALNPGNALIDWKTSNSIYADYILQLAAYEILWNENYPDNQITGGAHLCRFAKEEGDFGHHYYPSLENEKETFIKMRELFDMVKRVEKRVK